MMEGSILTKNKIAVAGNCFENNPNNARASKSCTHSLPPNCDNFSASLPPGWTPNPFEMMTSREEVCETEGLANGISGSLLDNSSLQGVTTLLTGTNPNNVIQV